jgi:K+-transporting ATPase ATPase A chain
MSIADWVQLCLFLITLIILVPLLGSYMAQVFEGNETFAHRYLAPLENINYKICGINPQEEMNWITYAKCLFFLNLFGFLALFLLLLFQESLPLNPQSFPGTSRSLAFNIAASFVTNTNWQSYAGESTLSYFSQMCGLTVQNFLSAATGMAVLLALVRGISKKNTQDLGNFWVDIVRFIVYIILPLSFIFAIVLVGQGVVQTFSPYVEATTWEGGKQVIPLGPVASQEAIKMLGTNGGGFFNANSAHPFENPTPLTNFLQSISIILISASTVYAFGVMINDRRHAISLIFVMFVIWCFGFGISIYSEDFTNPVLGVTGVLEGIETRFNIYPSILWSITTSATAHGSVNAMISSLPPIAGGVCLFNIMIEELVFGGVGVGLCAIIMFTLLTLFISGLMVGRTPEYFGKKIEIKEMQWVILAILTPGALILLGSAFSCLNPEALANLSQRGPHGLSELLYAFSSAAGNNGSAFAGINANNTYFNITLGVAMLLGRFSILVPSLAIAGLLARKKTSPISSGTFSSDGVLFVILLLSVILIVGGLTYFPALCLGPISEHILMIHGKGF